MVRFSFRKGLRFFEGQVCWTLMRRAVTSKLIFESDHAEQIALTEGEVYGRLENRSWRLDERSLNIPMQEIAFASPKDLRALSERDQAKVQRKLAYLNGVRQLLDGQPLCSSPEKLRGLIEAVAQDLGDSDPPSPSTIWRWWKRFGATQSPGKLVDRRRGGVSRKTQEQLQLLEEAVNEVYLSPQKIPIKRVVERVCQKIASLNKTRDEADQIVTPSRATIYRWMDTLYYEVVASERLGKQFTQRQLRQVMAGVKVSKVLERVELDHTPLDLNLICNKTKMVLGRPWLTLAIDRRSRMIVGFYISFHAPSATSVLYCLRMAVRPKDDILAKYPKLRNGWPAHGVIETLALDNGMEEHATSLERACLGMGTEILYCAPAMPQQKGAIERLFRTVGKGLIHQLPGTVFSNPQERGSYPAESLAVLDLDTFTEILVKWIVDDYHVTPHRHLQGKSPLQVWQDEAPNRIIDLPAYPAELDTMVGDQASRKVFHYGIEYESLRYNSSLLNAMRRRSGDTATVDIRAYEHDIGYIDVLDPERDEFIRVNAVDGDYVQGLTRHTHQLIMAEVRHRYTNDWTAEQRMEVKREIEQILEGAMRAKKTNTRKRAAAMRQHDSEQALGTRPIEALNMAFKPVDPQETSTSPLQPRREQRQAFRVSTL